MKTLQILSLLLMAVTVSCCTSSIENFVVGDNFINDQTGIVKIDTLTLKSSIVKFDSIQTDSPGRFLAGGNYNSISGYKNVNSFMTMAFDDNIDNIKFTFDSLCLILNYDKYYAGDTMVTQTLSVHRVLEEMKLDDKDHHLYSNSNFKYDATPLGSVSLKPKPISEADSVSIRLSDKLGIQLAQMIKDKTDTITSSDMFLKFFRGIVIKSEKNVKSAIFGYRTSDSGSTDKSSTSTTAATGRIKTRPQFRLYYHKNRDAEDEGELYYKFSFVKDGIHFNQFSEDLSGSLLDGIENTRNERNTKLTDNHSIAQSGIRIFTKIKIPYIDNLLQIGDNSALVGAQLRIYPIKGTYGYINGVPDLPDSLYVYGGDNRNELISQITLSGSSSSYAYALLTVENDVEKNVYYRIDISTFLESELATVTETNKSLMIGYGSKGAMNTAEHVILGGVNSGKYKPVLDVYYYHN